MTRFLLAAAIALLAAAAAPAATLVETEIAGQSVWVLDDPSRNRVLLAGRGGSRLIDLRSRTIYLIAPDGSAQRIDADALPEPAAAPGFSIEKIGPGPRVAEYPTTRFRLSIGGNTCSIIDANLTLATVMALASEAFALLDRLESALAAGNRSPCERIPFRSYARIGWGLQIADDGAPPVVTKAVIRDYQPLDEELTLPSAAVDVTQAVLDAAAAR